jgi:hypothetical protein
MSRDRVIKNEHFCFRFSLNAQKRRAQVVFSCFKQNLSASVSVVKKSSQAREFQE